MLKNNDQYEDISDQENEADFQEPEERQPVIQRDPFDDSIEKEDMRTPSDKGDSWAEPNKKGRDRER